MSEFRDMIIDIQVDIERGELSFRQIADKHNVSISTVDKVLLSLLEQYKDEDDHRAEDSYLDSMYEDRFDVEF